MYVDLNEQNEVARNSEASPKSVVDVLAGAVAALGAIAAFFYASLHYGGRAFRDAYLARYGFDSAVMPWSSDDLAYLDLVSDAQHHFLILAGVGFCALALGLPMLLARWLKIRRDAARLHLRRKHITEPRRANANPVIGDTLFLPSLGLFAVGMIAPLLGALGFFSLADSAGYDRAEHELEIIGRWDLPAMKTERFNFVQIVRSVANAPPTTVSGFLVSCGEKFCGVYSVTGTAYANVVPLDNIVSWKTFPLEDIPQESLPHARQPQGGPT